MRSALLNTIPRGLTIAAHADPLRARVVRADNALAHCKAQWQKAYDLANAKGLNTNKAIRMATVAYKLAIPNLDSLPSIRAAIACIAQGIRLEVFDGRDASQMLYAAQVAMSMVKEANKSHE